MASFGMLHRVALVSTDVSEELSASFIGVVFLRSVRRLLARDSVVPSSPILVTLLKEALSSSETWVLQEPHGVTSQKTPFFIASLVLSSCFVGSVVSIVYLC
jgi:hypothetical protein